MICKITPNAFLFAAVCATGGATGCAQAQPKPAVLPAPKAAPMTAYANDRAEVVVSRDGKDFLRFAWALWGPNWGWTGLDGKVTAQNGVASGELNGQLGGTQTPVKIAFRGEKTGPRTLKFTYSASVEKDSPLTLIVASFSPGEAFGGKDVQVTTTEGDKTIKMPFGMAGLGQSVQSVRLLDGANRATTLKFDPPIEIQSDGDARIVLAKDQLKAGDVRSVSVSVELPEAVQWYGGVSEIPDEPGLNTWYPWSATGDTSDSVLSMTDWNTDAAGRFGRVSRRGAQLIYNDHPIKLWGLNLSYGATAPEKPLADKRAAFYRKYGINAVRLHKWADGAGWQGIQSADSAVEFDADALDRFDYQNAKLKEAGVFIKLSATFGSLKLGAKEKATVPWMEEFGAFRDGRIETPHSAIHYSPELQAVQIAQVANLLKHRNPYTNLTYAEDPAVSFIEIINEQSILFYSSMGPLKASATLRKQVGKRFSDWLRAKYKDQAALDASWGEGGMNSLAGEVAFEGGESLENGVLPLGNPWFWDPDNLNGSQKPKRQRLLDTLEFLTILQDEFYARYTKAMRAAGYAGELVSSNWQAGRAMSHFANLHSDAQIGTIDRHNYFGGRANATMISRAGSGLLSTGMQQVSDRPFMLSEWIHTFPNEYGLEGPAILGAYGMGLQGWDVSYLFQNRDDGTFSSRIGRDEWDATAPQLLGVFPAVARHIRRGDVEESKVEAVRNVHFDSLFKGEIGFDDKVVQGYDVKELDSSKVPARALAVARSTVQFTDKPTDTPTFSLAPFEQKGALVSSTKQLSWMESPTTSTGGFFTMNTPATKAVVGFARGQKLILGEVTIEPQSNYGAIYVTVRGEQGTVANAKDLLIVAMGRARNTGQKFSPDGAAVLARGDGPILMEPLRARLSLKRAGTPQVFALDHDGKLTATKIAVVNGVLEIDGARDKTPYYLVRYP